MNSFTSNFRFKRLRRWSWGFICFVALFVIVDFGVFRNPYLYGLEYRSAIGQFAELAESFEHAEPSRITTIILGDSQSKDGLRPDLMAEAIGRDPESIFNFSISGGKAFDIYHTYLDYADSLTNVKEAIIVVNEHQLNANNMANDMKFRYYAGLLERLRIMDKDNYGELTLGWVSKAFDLRSVWSKILKSYLNETLPQKPVTEVWKPGGLRAETQVEPNGRTATYAESRADGWFDGYRLTGLQTDSLEKLLQNLHSKGVRIVILQIPRSDLFEETVIRKYGHQQQAYFDQISALAQQYGAEFDVMSNEGLDLEMHFRDTNHVNPAGAIIVSARVAQNWLSR